MKLWILMPFVMVGTAFADGYATYPQPSQAQPAAATVNSSLQNAGPAVAAMPAARKIDPQYPFGHLTEKMSYLAFAAIIKYQFPGHDDLDSLSLAKRAVAAYPIYADLVTFPPAN